MRYWYALHTKPHKERQVNTLLQVQGIETYLPTVQRKVRRRDRPERVIYFPCYLFARMDFKETPRSSIDWMPGIRRIVQAGESPAVVADEVVNLIRSRLEGKTVDERSQWDTGDRVRITVGPLRELEAVFDRALSAQDRVRVLLDVMGRMTPVEIDYREIESL